MQTRDDSRSFLLRPMRHPNGGEPEILVCSPRFGRSPIDCHPDHLDEGLGWGHEQPSAHRAAKALLLNVTGDPELASSAANAFVESVLRDVPTSTEYVLTFADVSSWAQAHVAMQGPSSLRAGADS